MVLSLKRLLNNDGERKTLDFKIQPCELGYIKSYEFEGPVHVKGEIFNRASVVTLKFSTEFTLRLVCDRCLKEFQRDFFYDFEHTVVRSLQSDNDDYIVAEDEKCDLSEVALSDVLLRLPSKILCKEDCKGLCVVCGCDLNESECDCFKNTVGD